MAIPPTIEIVGILATNFMKKINKITLLIINLVWDYSVMSYIYCRKLYFPDVSEIAGHWYGFGEANYFSYGNSVDNQRATSGTRTLTWSTTLNANVYNLLVGVGYKF